MKSLGLILFLLLQAPKAPTGVSATVTEHPFLPPAQNPFIQIAPGVVAEINLAKADAAFQKCKTDNPDNTVVCPSVRSKVAYEDAADRLKVLLKFLSVGHTDKQVRSAWATAKIKLQ